MFELVQIEANEIVKESEKEREEDLGVEKEKGRSVTDLTVKGDREGMIKFFENVVFMFTA